LLEHHGRESSHSRDPHHHLFWHRTHQGHYLLSRMLGMTCSSQRPLQSTRIATDSAPIRHSTMTPAFIYVSTKTVSSLVSTQIRCSALKTWNIDKCERMLCLWYTPNIIYQARWDEDVSASGPSNRSTATYTIVILEAGHL
jgi:hypothetical protein